MRRFELLLFHLMLIGALLCIERVRAFHASSSSDNRKFCQWTQTHTVVSNETFFQRMLVFSRVAHRTELEECVALNGAWRAGCCIEQPFCEFDSLLGVCAST